jgi:tripartite-type tricarboxylate transporter receptor subunit TctC
MFMKQLIRWTALWLFLVVPFACAAQDSEFPSRRIQMIVPTVPGGGQDVITRVVANQMAQDWGQTVVVVNRPGATGIMGSDIVAKAEPDGYTLMVQSFSHNTNPSLHKQKLPYDTLKDFTAVSLLATQALVLTSNPNIPVTNIKEFIALAKANPAKFNYASGGYGSSQHLIAELFSYKAGINVVHIPYPGIAPGMQAVITGDCAFIFNQISTAVPYIGAGQLRALAVTSKEPSPLLPGVPTMDSSGLPGFEATTWFGLFGPAGMPKSVVAKLNAEIAHILKMPAIKDKLAALGVDVDGGSPEHFQSFIETENAKWGEFIAQRSIKVE